MNTRKWRAALLALGAALACPCDALSQSPIEFLPGNGATANFATPGNWEDVGFGNNLPSGEFNEQAVISTGATAVLNTTLAVGPGDLFISDGAVEVDNVTLTLSAPAVEPIDVNRQATVDGLLRLKGSGQLLGASVAFGNDANLGIEFSAATALPIDVDSLATLGGSLDLDFTSFPTASGSFQLIDAGLVIGGFEQVSVRGLSPGRGVSIANTGSQLSATVADVLSITVNRESGAVFIENTHPSPVSIDGYSIRSESGSLSLAGFAGLGLGWESSASNSVNALTQLFEGDTLASDSDTLPASSGPILLGNIYSATQPTAFGQDVEDLQFIHSGPDGTFNGSVAYAGEGRIENNIVLTIDSTGNAVMLNESAFPQQVEAYRITSDDGVLSTEGWTSLDDTNADDGTWSESGLSDTSVLFELQEGANPGDLGNDNATTFDNTTLFDLGSIYAGGVAEQGGITFEFLLAGDSQFTQGAVVFDDLPVVGLTGDYNDDGLVNAVDYAVWRDNLGGSASALSNRAIGVIGPVGQLDYDAWLANYGNATALSASIPEPTAVGLLVFGGTIFSFRRRFSTGFIA